MFESHLEDIEIFDQRIHFFTVTGTVLDANRTTDTRTTSSGGGGYIGRYGGVVSDVNISSKTTVRDTIWLETEDGEERKFQFVDCEFRVGATLTMIYACVGEKTTGFVVAIVNHNEKKVIDQDGLVILARQKEISPSKGPLILWITIGIAIGVVLGGRHGTIGGFFGFVAGWFISLFFTGYQSNKGRNIFSEHIKKMGDGILNEIPAIRKGPHETIDPEESTVPHDKSMSYELNRIHKLMTDGVISSDEFSVLKERLLSRA